MKDEWIVEGVIEDEEMMQGDPGSGPEFVHEVVLYHTNSARIIWAMATCEYFSGTKWDYGNINRIRYDPRCPRGKRKEFDRMVEEALNKEGLAGVR